MLPVTEPKPFARTQSAESGAPSPQGLIAISAALLTILLLRTAWVAEDAYISFRVLDNFLHGYGPRRNIADRVQT